MSTTYGELKSQIVDMGFEEDEILSDSEYGRVIRNAINRAQNVIYTNVALQIEPFLLLYDNNWDTPDETHISKPVMLTAESTDATKIKISDFIAPLLPLLVAHYVWLDDDIQKSTYYYNQFDAMRTDLLNVANKPRMATIEGGY